MADKSNQNESKANSPDMNTLEDIKDTIKEYFGVLQNIQKVNAEVVDNLREYKMVINENRQLRMENERLKKEILDLKEQQLEEEMERD